MNKYHSTATSRAEKAAAQERLYSNNLNKILNSHNPNFAVHSAAHEIYTLAPNNTFFGISERDIVEDRASSAKMMSMQGMLEKCSEEFNNSVIRVGFQLDSDRSALEASFFSMYIVTLCDTRDGQNIETTKRVSVVFPAQTKLTEKMDVLTKIYAAVPKQYQKLFRDIVRTQMVPDSSWQKKQKEVDPATINLQKIGENSFGVGSPSLVEQFATKVASIVKPLIHKAPDPVMKHESKIELPEDEAINIEELNKVENKREKVEQQKPDVHPELQIKIQKDVDSFDDVLTEYTNMITVADEGRPLSKVSLVVTQMGKKFASFVRSAALIALRRKTRTEKSMLQEKAKEFTTMIHSFFGMKALLAYKSKFNEQWEQISEMMKTLPEKSSRIKDTLLSHLGVYTVKKIAVEKPQVPKNQIFENQVRMTKTSDVVYINGEKVRLHQDVKKPEISKVPPKKPMVQPEGKKVHTDRPVYPPLEIKKSTFAVEEKEVKKGWLGSMWNSAKEKVTSMWK